MNVLGDDVFDRASVTDPSDDESVGSLQSLDDWGDVVAWQDEFVGEDLGRKMTRPELWLIDAVVRCSYDEAIQLYRTHRTEIHNDFRSYIVSVVVSTTSVDPFTRQEVPVVTHPQQSEMSQRKAGCLHQFFDTPMPMESRQLFSQGENEEDTVSIACFIWEGLFSTGRASHNILNILPDIMRTQNVSSARLRRVYDYYRCVLEVDGTQEVADDSIANRPVQNLTELVQALEDAGEFDSTMNWLTIAAAAFMRLALLTGITLTARDLSEAPSPMLQLLNGFFQDDDLLRTEFLEMAMVISTTFVTNHLASGPGHFEPPMQQLHSALAHCRVDYLLLDTCAAFSDLWLRRVLYRARTPLLLLSPFLCRNQELLALLLVAILSTQDRATPARAKEIAASPIGQFTVQLCAR